MGSDKVYHVEAGEPAPITGWLMSDEKLAELYDALEEKLPAETDEELKGPAETAPTP